MLYKIEIFFSIFRFLFQTRDFPVLHFFFFSNHRKLQKEIFLAQKFTKIVNETFLGDFQTLCQALLI